MAHGPDPPDSVEVGQSPAGSSGKQALANRIGPIPPDYA